jgi:hypothetical protein
MFTSPIRLDISKWSYHLVVTTVSPLLPGGVLLLGIGFSRRSWFSQFIEYTPLGYYFKIGVLLFSAYIAGHLLMVTVELLSQSFWMGLNALTRSAISRWVMGSRHPSTGETYRKAAGEFLGKAAPPFQEGFNPVVSQFEETRLSLIADPSEKLKAMTERSNRIAAVQLSDFQWQFWYEDFKVYFRLPSQNLLFTLHYISVLHSLGWAGIVALRLAQVKPISPYLLCFAPILVGLGGSLWNLCATGAFGTDTLGSEVTAALMHENAAREKRPANPSS